jgi:hypothetical protein
MDPVFELAREITRRELFNQCSVGIGAIALASLLKDEAYGRSESVNPLAPKGPHFRPRAKTVISLHMAGAPPHHELFDYKPKLVQLNGELCPKEILKNERFAFIKGHPRLLGTPYKFRPHGKSGILISELLPNIAGVVDEITVIKSMYTDQFNHAPAQMFLYTGSPRFGNPSMGSWLTYGLGTENQDLPAFVVLVTGKTPDAGTSVWGSGFLPTIFQGVRCRSEAEPVLYVSNPKGMDRSARRRSLDALRRLNQLQYEQSGDPETMTRIEQYEMAFRMQVSVPEVMDISKEPKQVHEMYGTEPGKASFANNCLLARRLVERGVRFVQLFDWGWDTHGTSAGDDIVNHLPNKCKQVDRPIAALIRDLKDRGLLDQTLVIWAGEFGRTAMNEKRNDSKFLGRDHHPHCFAIWMAGGGVKGGFSYGETDDLGYFVAQDKMHVHDLQATVLHLLGMDHRRLTFRFQSLEQRLTSVTREAVVHQAILA